MRSSVKKELVIKLKKWMPWLVTLIVIGALVGILMLPPVRTGPIGEAAGKVIAPVQKLADKVSAKVEEWLEIVHVNQDLIDENEELHLRADAFVTVEQQVDELTAENERLRQLLGVTEENDKMEFLQATIIAKSAETWYDTLVINQGSSAGVTENMAVITQDGLLGRVTQVYETYAHVQTILDGRSAVSVRVERTRDNGVLKGQMLLGSEEPYCRLLYLRPDADLVPGDELVTTELDGTLPRGLVVGEVVEVGRVDGEDKYALVKPMADIARAEDVLVVLTRPQSADIAQEE